jgi:hypothetical protein
MAFDTSTRNRLQKFVSLARSILSEEFTRQLQATYGMDPKTGSISDVESLSHLDNASGRWQKPSGKPLPTIWTIPRGNRSPIVPFRLWTEWFVSRLLRYSIASLPCEWLKSADSCLNPSARGIAPRDSSSISTSLRMHWEKPVQPIKVISSVCLMSSPRIWRCCLIDTAYMDCSFPGNQPCVSC